MKARPKKSRQLCGSWEPIERPSHKPQGSLAGRRFPRHIGTQRPNGCERSAQHSRSELVEPSTEDHVARGGREHDLGAFSDELITPRSVWCLVAAVRRATVDEKCVLDGRCPWRPLIRQELHAEMPAEVFDIWNVAIRVAVASLACDRHRQNSIWRHDLCERSEDTRRVDAADQHTDSSRSSSRPFRGFQQPTTKLECEILERRCRATDR